MAGIEITGLVIGGVAIATLFDTAISCFERVQTGKDFGPSFARYRTSLQVLQLRLSRWKDAAAELVEAKDPEMDKLDGELVKEILEDITDLFKKAERQAKRFKKADTGSAATTTPSTGSEANALAKTLNKLSLKHQRRTKLRDHIKWAIYAENEFKTLLDNITIQVNNLDTVYATEKLVDRLKQMRIEDAETLGANVEIKSEDLGLVTASAKECDAALETPLKTAFENRQGGHYYLVNTVDEDAQVEMGDFVDKDYKGPLGISEHVFNGNIIRGSGQVRMGNTYSGSVFFTPRTLQPGLPNQ